MSLAALVLVAQLSAAAQPSPAVLAFPEAGLDDSAAYAGYRTRFHRDAAGNTVQVYVDRREGRVVTLLANGENESVGFSARTPDERSAPLEWDDADARVARDGRAATFSYTLRSDAPAIMLGRFVLGSMRIERDVQYFKEHRRPFTDAPYVLAEHAAIVDALAQQPVTTRRMVLAAWRAADLATLQARRAPRHLARPGTDLPNPVGTVIEQVALDGVDTLHLTITPIGGTVLLEGGVQRIALRAAPNAPLRFRVTVRTTGRALTPLTRREIFTPDFLAWADTVRRTGDATRARWIERQITGVELLASREKLMAGLPTYATYFGRDMLLSALMMQPIWRAEMTEFVIAAALRKLAPNGEVSHEEALGGQAVREAAAEATMLFRRADSARGPTADSLRTRAVAVLREARRPRENYHMVDDEYQLPLLVARWLDDPRLDAAHKRRWLLAREGGVTRLTLLLHALGVVADRSAAYAAQPVPSNFVPFAPRDATAGVYDGAPRWFAQSWRDSGAGYANGKYAMDVNAVYIPQALMAMQRILPSLRTLGVLAVRGPAAPALPKHTALARYLADSSALGAAIRTWQGAATAFLVTLPAMEVQQRVAARVNAMPDAERRYWRAFPPSGEGITFPALALDANTQPIAVVNSDPATRLFLEGLMGTARVTGASRDALRRDVALFAREYPEGLLVPGIGAVVANDAYSTPPVWQAFVEDAYHGPRVVWGREVNLFLLGVASHLPLVQQDAATTTLLRETAARVRDAVAASGFRSELWSYEFPNGRPQPVRYGSGGDVQLWSTTDLAVQYVWSRLAP